MKKMRPGPAKTSVQKRALAILKQKKMYEKQKEATMNQQFNVDQIMFAQDSLKETVSTVSAMKDANKALKKQFKQINISKVEDLQDDMSDLLEQAEEVQNALSRSYATDDIDEADLEVRLACPNAARRARCTRQANLLSPPPAVGPPHTHAQLLEPVSLGAHARRSTFVVSGRAGDDGGRSVSLPL